MPLSLRLSRPLANAIMLLLLLELLSGEQL